MLAAPDNPDVGGERITKAELLGALSYALDMVDGQPEGHAARTCLIGLKIADALSLAEPLKDSLYFASWLKDAGCSNNSARIHKLFGGDDFLSKRASKLIDWSNPIESVKFVLQHTERDGTVSAKLRRMLSNIGTPAKVMDSVTTARCTRGAEIALMLGFDHHTADAIRDLDEHWDGRGSPRHREREEIPLLARILGLSQTLEIFVTTFGIDEGYRMLQQRSGRWFDPQLVKVCDAFRRDDAFWKDHAIRATDATLEMTIPAAAQIAEETDIDRICEAFALIVDAKSSFTAEHSTRVTKYTMELAETFGISARRKTTLRRAALLHDIGKLGVTNSILEKPGKPTDEEFAAIRLHPRFTYEILKPIRGFARVAEVAACHHERLDGRGYWRGLDATQLDLDMRMIAVADVFDALSADRPYRDAMPMDRVFAILHEESVSGLDPDCVAALRDKYFQSNVARAA